MNIILFETFPEHGFLPWSDERANHIRKILKLTVGDTFHMGLINGAAGEAEITAVSEDGLWISWREIIPQEISAHLYPVTLLVAQVRPICMKRILREAVSLGVKRIIVSGADTAENSYKEAGIWKHGDYKKHLFDGAQQSGRTGICEIVLKENIKDALICIDASTVNKLVLDIGQGGDSLSKVTIEHGETVLAIGPERGWSETERTQFHNAGFITATLGERILRTETACSVALGVLLTQMGLL